MATQHKKATEISSFNSILTWISYVSSIGCRRTTHNPMVPLDSPPRRIGTLWSASTECFYARINRAPKIVLHPVIVILVVIAIEGAGVVFPVPATKAMDAPMALASCAEPSNGGLAAWASVWEELLDCGWRLRGRWWRRRHWHSLRLRFITISSSWSCHQHAWMMVARTFSALIDRLPLLLSTKLNPSFDPSALSIFSSIISLPQSNQ